MDEPELHKSVANCCLSMVRTLLVQDGDINHQNRQGQTVLHLAIKRNYKPLICLLIENGAQVNVRDDEGCTPLHVAVLARNRDSVKALLNKGAETETKDVYDQTPLHMAAWASDWAIYEMLLKVSANWYPQDCSGRTPLQVILSRKCISNENCLNISDIINLKNKDNETVLHRTLKRCHLNVAKQLLHFGADSNLQDMNGWTPLHVAVNKNLRHIIEPLIRSGAKVNKHNNKGDTPLHIAVLKRNIRMIADLLDNGADIDCGNNDKDTPLYVAVKNKCFGEAIFLLERGASICGDGVLIYNYCTDHKHLKLFKKLLDNKISFSTVRSDEYYDPEPMFYAIQQGFYSAVSLALLKNEVDINDRYYNGWTILHLTCVNSKFVAKLLNKGANIEARDNKGQTPLFNAVDIGYVKSTKLLLSRGANVNVKDKNGKTPLHFAIKSAECIDILLNFGADVEAKDNMGQTPLFRAVMYSNNNERLGLEKLLARGANINAKDNEGRTVLYLSQISDEAHQYLIDHGADVNVKDSHGQTPLHVVDEMNCRFDQLLRNGANLDEPDNDGITPLQQILIKKDLIPSKPLCIKTLLSLKNGGRTILHLAVNTWCVKFLEWLLARGADVNDKDSKGNTPLHLATESIEELALETSEVLIKRGAEVNSQNIHGDTPLHFAARYNKLQLIALLLSKKAKMDVPNNENETPLAIQFDYFEEHIVKLKTAHLEEDITCDVNSVDCSGGIFKHRCVKELKKMKAVQVGIQPFFLTDVFFRYKDPIFVKNSELCEVIESPGLKDKFPIYASLLKEKYRSAKERYLMLDSTELNVTIMMGGVEKVVTLPREVIRMILSQLSDSDLSNVIKANEVHTSRQ